MRGFAGTQQAKKGAGIRFLTEAITSPTIAEQVSLIQQAFPQAKWHQWDGVPIGTRAGAAVASDAFYHFDKADVIVALDADLFGRGPGCVRHARDFATRRRAFDGVDPTGKSAAKGDMNRLYAVESTPSLTGGKADHRLVLRASEIEAFGGALAAAIGTAGTGAQAGGGFSSKDAQRFLAAVAKDLQAHRGTSLVVAGEYQPAAVHALARAMNDALGNTGTTVTYLPAIDIHPTDRVASLKDLMNAIDAGQVELLVILGGNPAFTAPSDLKFREHLQKVPLAVHHSLYQNETSTFCHWNVASAHPFESWGDARGVEGTVTIMQPLIAPLYNGHTMQEVLACFIDAQAGKSAHDLVKDYWTRALAGKAGSWTITDPTGQPFKSPESFWRHVLNDGWVTGTAMQAAARGSQAANAGAPAPAAPQPPTSASPSAASGGLEIIFRPDPTIWDGRFANNGWLQELPKPMSKATWDPSAWISPRLAEQQKLDDYDLIELRYRGQTAKLPVLIVPGHPDESVTVFYGYGRQRTGRVGVPADDTAKEFNLFPLRTSDALWFGQGLEIANTGLRYTLARTQKEQVMEGRAPVRVADVAEYQRDPDVIQRQGDETPPRALSLIPDWEYNGYKWGMAVDLTACTGCGTCVIACVAENNIPVVGKEQVNAGRHMHWIRVDHYFAGDFDNPETYSQPIPCQQCENAPCELVCPVGATTHSAEGLNDMVYNRCVGTRYCSNNCPYKVRRFNFLLYSDWYTPSLEPLRNPDVTVRSRGVMEKCTYCVQRINAAKIDAERADRRVHDGEITPACAGACPADAIVFGDLNDPTSRVTKLKQLQRNYGLLENLNTRPRTTYLASIRNPNPELA
jgi:molybdopterin-containing oxidoreductase family iron-sulfur binding subunit